MSNQTLHLRILDLDRLANGGPLEAVLDSGERLTIGRDAGADWPLPDQRRFISGRHLEFRYENDAWWMHDLSTNGTFVNGAATRVESPYRLTSGDRLQIGHYTMAVTVVGDLGMGDDAWDDDTTVVSTVTPRAPEPQTSTPPQAMTPPPAPAPELPEAQPGADTGAASTPKPQAGGEAIPESWLDDLDLPAAADAEAGPDTFPDQPTIRPDAAAAPEEPAPISPSSLPSGLPSDPGLSPVQSIPPEPGAASEPAFEPAFEPVPEPEPEPETQVSANPFAGTVSDPEPVSAPPVAPTPAVSSPPVSAPPTSTPPVSAAPAATNPPKPGTRALPPDAVLAAICKAAGLPSGTLSTGNQTATATEIGHALKLMAEELTALLQARAVERQTVTGGEMTMIGRGDNNPLKFMPSAEQALNIMFGPPRQGFQRGSDAVRTSFDDIRHHQKATSAAVAPALSRLLTELSPETIEAGTSSSGLLSNPKARAWETFVEQWNARAEGHQDGMADVFMGYFSDAYDAQGKAP